MISTIGLIDNQADRLMHASSHTRTTKKDLLHKTRGI